MRRKPRPIDPDMLKAHMSYDPETGIFTSKIATKRRPVGTTFGPPAPGEYVRISFAGVQYAAHRMAWVYVHGVQPDEIDHLNHRKDDNRIANLRSCTHLENCRNLHPRRRRQRSKDQE